MANNPPSHVGVFSGHCETSQRFADSSSVESAPQLPRLLLATDPGPGCSSWPLVAGERARGRTLEAAQPGLPTSEQIDTGEEELRRGEY